MNRARIARVVLVSFALICAGCVTVSRNPASHPRRSPGKLLGVIENERTFSTVERENLVDLNGSNARQGSAFGLNIGRDVERERTVHTFLLTYGGLPVDEQDFYELAGDVEAVRQIARARDEAVKTQEFWSGVGPAAVVAGCTGGVCLGVLGVRGVMSSGIGTTEAALFGGGGVLTLGGVLVAASGSALASQAGATLEAPTYRFPVERARAAAAAHNARRARAKPSAAVASTIELNDDLECVDEAALRKAIEPLAAKADVRVRVSVVDGERGMARVKVTIGSGNGDETSRVLDVDLDRCEDVPTLVTRVLRAHKGG